MNKPFVPSPLSGIHHSAYRCLDAEQTRWFYEDLLGLKLAAALVFEEAPGTAEPVEYMHLFFEMGDGKYIAFFDAPGNAQDNSFDRKHSFDVHVAFEVDSEEELLAMQKRVQDGGKSCLGPVDHGFVKSVYMYDPNGLQVEITYRTPEHDRILEDEQRSARQIMADWTARTREEKARRFGAANLDKRGTAA